MICISSEFECLSLPHVNTLNKLFCSFGLESDFCAYLVQATSCFSSEKKHVIVQTDEIRVRSDFAYKGERSLRRPEHYSL